MAEGDFASWRCTDDASGVTTASPPIVFDTEVVRDPSFSLAGSNQRVTISEAGRYLVRWDCAARRNPPQSGLVRALILGTLRLNGTTVLEGGRALCYWRNLEGCDEGGACSGTIVDLVANDYLELIFQRVDTAGVNGASVQGSSSNLIASISIWRVPDSWELVDLRADADQTPSVQDGSQTAGLRIVTAEGGWSGSGSIGSLIGRATYEPPGSLDLLFLVCFSLEALSSSTTIQGLLECVLMHSDGIGIDPTLTEKARVTSYTEGPNSCTRAIGTWVGLVDALQGEGGEPFIELQYLHRNSGAASMTPKANLIRFQALAIPKADVDYVMARVQDAGQNASVSGKVYFDQTAHEDASWDHNPGGLDPRKIRAVGDGHWAIAFASAYARPVNGARVAERLSHQLELRVEGLGLGHSGAVSMDRGLSQECDRSGLSVSGIVRLETDEELELFHEQMASG